MPDFILYNFYSKIDWNEEQKRGLWVSNSYFDDGNPSAVLLYHQSIAKVYINHDLILNSRSSQTLKHRGWADGPINSMEIRIIRIESINIFLVRASRWTSFERRGIGKLELKKRIGKRNLIFISRTLITFCLWACWEWKVLGNN